MNSEEEQRFREEAIALERLLGEAMTAQLPDFLRSREVLERLIATQVVAAGSQRSSQELLRDQHQNQAINAVERALRDLQQRLAGQPEQFAQSLAPLLDKSRQSADAAGRRVDDSVAGVRDGLARIANQQDATSRNLAEVHAAVERLERSVEKSERAPAALEKIVRDLATKIERLAVEQVRRADSAWRSGTTGHLQPPSATTEPGSAPLATGSDGQIRDSLARIEYELRLRKPPNGLIGWLRMIVGFSCGVALWLLVAGIFFLGTTHVGSRLDAIEQRLQVKGSIPTGNTKTPAVATDNGAPNPEGGVRVGSVSGPSAGGTEAAPTSNRSGVAVPVLAQTSPADGPDHWANLWQRALDEEPKKSCLSSATTPKKQKVRDCVCGERTTCQPDLSWSDTQAMLVLQAVLRQTPGNDRVGVDGKFGQDTVKALEKLDNCREAINPEIPRLPHLGNEARPGLGGAVEAPGREAILSVFQSLHSLPLECLKK